MKTVFIGCVKSSERFLKTLLSLNVEVVGLVTKKSSTFNADFVDLIPLAESHDIPIYYFKPDASPDELHHWIKDKNPEIICCFGWSHLLQDDLIKIPPKGIIGYHPSKLPENRGRHPIVWSLALGLKETASSFFYITAGADEGEIISQKIVPISSVDDASTLYDKLLDAGNIQIHEFWPLLKLGQLKSISQGEHLTNSWRKRGASDSIIDFRMTANQIYNLVRALTKPYIGAEIQFRGSLYKVWKVEIFPKATPENFEPGKVLSVDNNIITVKCADGAIRLLKHELTHTINKDDYII